MSQAAQSYLFFLKCPDLTELLSFTAELIADDTNKRKSYSVFHKRILICRELLFSEMELVATPVFSSRTEIIVVVPKCKFCSSNFQKKLNKMGLKIIKVDDALPVHLQECLTYTAIAKLAPQWNSVQDLLVQGRDFFLTSDPLRAIKFDIFVDGSEIILSVVPKCIKLPLFRVETYSKLYEFSENTITIQENVHVLPSFKKGNAVYLSKNILTKKLFKDYSEMKKHWKNMYGYRLPEIPEDNIWYLNVVFNVPFSTSYTYPVFCVKPFGMTEVYRVDPQLTLNSFINDFCKKVQNICQEKCRITDTKASFPSLKLYRIEEVLKNPLPRPGTTYTKPINIPYRSSMIVQRNNGNSLKNSTSQTKEYPSSVISKNKLLTNPEQRSSVQTNTNIICMSGKIYKENSLDKLNNTLLKNVGINSNKINSIDDNGTGKKLPNFAKSSSSESEKAKTYDYQQVAKTFSETQPKYAPKFFPKKSRVNSNLSLKDTFKGNLTHDGAKSPVKKYAPKFISKQAKQISPAIVDPKVKTAIHASNLPLKKVRNISQPRDLNCKGVINQNLNLILDPLKTSVIDEKLKRLKINPTNISKREGKYPQDEAIKCMRKKVYSGKRISDEQKGNKTKNAKHG